MRVMYSFRAYSHSIISQRRWVEFLAVYQIINRAKKREKFFPKRDINFFVNAYFKGGTHAATRVVRSVIQFPLKQYKTNISHHPLPPVFPQRARYTNAPNYEWITNLFFVLQDVAYSASVIL